MTQNKILQLLVPILLINIHNSLFFMITSVVKNDVLQLILQDFALLLLYWYIFISVTMF